MTDRAGRLEVSELTLSFAGVTALDRVSFAVEPGTRFAVIGPNGAGKTSILNCLSGIYRPQSGTARLDGRDLVARRDVASLGVARTFQNLGLFRQLTVLENMMLGRHRLMHTGFAAGALWWGRAKREELRHRRHVEEMLDAFDLGSMSDSEVAELPLGIQKRIEVARALAMEPKLLLLDEPAGGMSSDETRRLTAHVLDVVRDLGVTLVLVEHDMKMVMGVAERVLVLNFGSVIAVGSPAEVQADELVRQAYLGAGSPPATPAPRQPLPAQSDVVLEGSGSDG